MGLFDVFKRKPPTPARPPARPALIVALDAWQAPDVDAASKLLEPLTARKVAIELDTGEGDSVLVGRVTFGGHEVRVVGFDVPVPKSIMEKTVECSAWQGEPRERLRNHQSHLILFHENGGEDVADRITALFQIAGALGGDGLSGAIHESGWTCASREVVREFLDFEQAKDLREFLPPIIYFGVLPFTEEDSWVATKGCHLFGVPDLVIERSGESNTELFSLLHNIFVYMVRGSKIAPGHTMQTGEDRFFRFNELSPDHKHRDTLLGEGATLKLTRIDRQEVKPEALRRPGS